MLIPLICKQCGGNLEVEKSKILELSEVVVVLPNQTFNCPNCGVTYLAGDKIKQASGRVTISIGGNVSGSSIIVGNGNAVIRKPKKWWQFWKK